MTSSGRVSRPFEHNHNSKQPWAARQLCRAQNDKQGSPFFPPYREAAKAPLPLAPGAKPAIKLDSPQQRGNSWNGANDFSQSHTGPAVSRQIYDQVAASRNRISKQLSAKNKYIRHLEASLEERSQAVETAHKALLQIRRELESVQRLSELAAAAARFGLDKVDIVNRSDRVAKRAESLYQGMSEDLAALDRLLFRKVPITWYGLATEVRLVGDFDGWTEGFSLSPENIQDQTFTRFTAEVPLRPGTYLVKFKVDNTHWRLAADWPTQDGDDGNTNNVLIVP